MPAGHAVELGVEFPRFEFGFGFDLLPAFPPASVSAGKDVLRRGLGLAEFLLLRFAFAA
ncbi:MAG: hypothetical protein OXG78_08470 [Chloroflexi bacterium]|nr:hypothetical protein [Chloroflexota bacterium]